MTNNASIVGSIVLAGVVTVHSLLPVVADGVDGPPLASLTQLSSGSGTVAVSNSHITVIDTITDAEYTVPAPTVAYLRVSIINPTLPPTINGSVGPPPPRET